MIKVCCKCKKEKSLDDFHNKKTTKDGKALSCKECRKDEYRKTYESRKELYIEKAKLYYEKNKESILKKRDKERAKEYNREYRAKNSEKTSEYNKKYKELNSDKIKLRRSEYRKENQDKINQYNRDLRVKDPMFAIKKSIRNRLWEILSGQHTEKDKKFIEYIGCSLDKLKEHIETQFKSGMSWDNYGKEWHIDHILPISNARNEQQVYILSNYRNLRPLFKNDNLKKNNRADICWQKLQRDITEEEDRLNGYNFNLKVKDFVFSNEKRTEEHTKFIQRYEWLGTIGYSPRYCFTARYEGKLAGVVLMSEPNTYQFDKKLEALISRGACSSWAPKHLNSALVMFACRWMVNNTDKRLFTAYSDPSAGEIGTIYQACNFDYLGQGYGSTNLYRLKSGKIVNSRFFTTSYALNLWAKELNIFLDPLWKKDNGYLDLKKIPEDILIKLKELAKNKQKESKKINIERKGKYVLLLKRNKREIINKTWESKPYPKRVKYN